MPGLLTHLSVAFVGFFIINFIFKDWKYGLVFVIGQLIPDIIRFGITGIANETLNFGEITSQALFWKLSFTHYAITWVIVFAMVFAVIFILYMLKKINKKKFKEWFIADLIFLTAIIIHLILDALIIEKSYWI